MYGYIYKTTDTSNGKIYIGQHKSKVFDHKYNGSGIIIKSIKKKRKDDLTTEVIEWCVTQSELDEREIYWISVSNSTNPNIGYNISKGQPTGGTGANNKGRKRTPEIRKKISETTKEVMKNPEIRKKLSDVQKGRCGEKNGFFGKQHTDEQKKRWSEQRKGKHLSNETKRKISLANKGKKGKPCSEETKKKLSESNKGKKLSEKTKTKMSKAQSGKSKPKHIWITPEYELVYMASSPVSRYHPDWICIE